MNEICLLPRPQSIAPREGVWIVPQTPTAALTGELAALAAPLRTLWPQLSAGAPGHIVFETDDALPREGYRLTVSPAGAVVASAAPAGAFYALMTLRQLALQYPAGVPACVVEDAPALALRGAMLDISRGKVPTMETLEAVADKLASFKMNHLELYLEGFSFAYPSFPGVWADGTPVTPEELRRFDAYCKARFIDLAPCQNSLGHMAAWLAKPEWNALAETPDGFAVKGLRLPPTTMDPRDPGSLALVERMLDDLLPNFTSPYCNVCLDEPFELGMGKSRGGDKQAFYLTYAARLRDAVTARGKTMMMWGDVVGRDETAAARLPKDVVVLDWGYEAQHPVEQRAAALQRAGLQFCLCPGTNSWASFTGITDNMLACVRRAAAAAHRYGALGLIVTDWGDMGHLQYLPVLWPGVCLAAALAWDGRDVPEAQLARALDLFVFCDAAGVLGQLALDAGRYAGLEEFLLPCRTLATTPLMSGLVTAEAYAKTLALQAQMITFFSPPQVCEFYLDSYACRKPLDAPALLAFFAQLERRLGTAAPACADGVLAKQEYQNALCMLRVLTRVRACIVDGAPRDGLAGELDAVMDRHRALWLARNRTGGLEEGLAGFRRLRQQAAGEG